MKLPNPLGAVNQMAAELDLTKVPPEVFITIWSEENQPLDVRLRARLAETINSPAERRRVLARGRRRAKT